MNFKLLLVSSSLLASTLVHGQQNNNGPSITGNMETTFQLLNEDTLIGATQPPSKSLVNSYMNVFYRQAGFKAGVRVESYLPAIQGYPENFQGTGLGMRYVGYQNDFVDITLGHFYEQFGAGLILRAYENRALGYDNVMDGMKLTIRPYKGIVIKTVYGNQRNRFIDGRIINADGIVRGGDISFRLDEYSKWLKNNKLDIRVAGSLVSKYQVDDNQTYVLPENVGAYGGRVSARYKRFYGDFEYVMHDNDPNSDNNYIYNKGHAGLFNIGYSQKGLGILFSMKSVDNMSFRSDRTESLQNAFINFLPAMNKTHTYNLVASLYPYVTQPLGEVAYQGELVYSVPKKSKLGGKYGMTINLNYSAAYQPIRDYGGYSVIDSNNVANPVANDRVAYSTRPFNPSDSLYWQDINVTIAKKFSKKLDMKLNYYNISLNNDVAKVAGASGIIQSDIFVLETGYKFNRKHYLRTEVQSLFTKKDQGDWVTFVAEYNLRPGFFFGIMDQYNYGNPNPNLRLHYVIGTFGYVKESTRITLSYGKQRAGLFCVGGVCRFVPASNGLTVNFTQSF